MTAVIGGKDTAASQDETRILADKINVVDGVLGADGPLNPSGATILGVADETAVTGDPALFRIDEVNGVQVLAARADALAAPSALSNRNRRRQHNHGRRQRHLLVPFSFHNQLPKVLHITGVLTKTGIR